MRCVWTEVCKEGGMVCALLPLVGAFFVFDISVPATWVGATAAVPLGFTLCETIFSQETVASESKSLLPQLSTLFQETSSTHFNNPKRSEHSKRSKHSCQVVIYAGPFALWARSVRLAEEAFPAKELQANPYRMPCGGHIFSAGVVANVLVAASLPITVCR